MKTPNTYSSNPAITSIFTADPSAHVWDDGKIYIYASHDMDPARGCDLMDRYHVFSSEDMVNWLDEGEILAAADVKWGRPEGGFMWAPDAAYKNGTYYFYYPHPSGTEWNKTWKMGVASSKYPAKEFTDLGYIDGMGGFALIDPCVLVDDDNRAYIYYGGGSRCMGGELNEDMISLKTPMVDMIGLDDFHEAAWAFKRNGIYYLTYSDNNHGANHMKYCISENPLGPWEYKGIFLEPTGCDTSHGSVVEYKGQWYMFYHNQAISGRGNLRSVCIDKLFFNDDGTIKTVEQTKTGVPAVGDPPKICPFLKEYPSPNTAVLKEGEAVTFSNVSGHKGVRVSLHVNYKTEAPLAKLNLKVNGFDYTLINALGSDEYTNLTVTMNEGETNEVVLTAAKGEISIIKLEAYPLR